MSKQDDAGRRPRVHVSYRTERRAGAVGRVALPSRYRHAGQEPNGEALEEARAAEVEERPGVAGGSPGDGPAATMAKASKGLVRSLQLPPPDAVGTVSVPYVVRAGDTLSSIAQRFNVPLARLVAVNEPFVRDDRIFAGQVLEIPLREPTLPPLEPALALFVAEPGDTLARVAERFQVPAAAVAAVNPGLGPDVLAAGTVVAVPAVAGVAGIDPPPQLYVVQPGDTLAEIADRFGITLASLRAANPGAAGDEIFPGEILVIPLAGRPAEVFRRVRYIIQPGDTLARIAAQFQTTLPLLEQANVFLAPLAGLVIAIPMPVAVPEAPEAPAGFPSCLPPPFGRRLNLEDDDTAFVAFPAGFTFRFFGQPVANGVFVNSNGNLTFGQGDPSFIASTDAFLEGLPRIAGLWTDLIPAPRATPGGVFVETVQADEPGGPRLVVTWDRVPYFFAMDRFQTFQISLHGDDTISICYFSVDTITPQGLRTLVGVGGGANNPRGNVFLFNGGDNPRRLGPAEPTPNDGLTGRILVYRFDPDIGNYRLRFTTP